MTRLTIVPTAFICAVKVDEAAALAALGELISS